MRNVIIAAAIAATLAGYGYVQANSPLEIAPAAMSAYDLMATAKNLPTDPSFDAI
jgi:hypothetical protein